MADNLSTKSATNGKPEEVNSNLRCLSACRPNGGSCNLVSKSTLRCVIIEDYYLHSKTEGAAIQQYQIPYGYHTEPDHTRYHTETPVLTSKTKASKTSPLTSGHPDPRSRRCHNKSQIFMRQTTTRSHPLHFLVL